MPRVITTLQIPRPSHPQTIKEPIASRRGRVIGVGLVVASFILVGFLIWLGEWKFFNH